jgi:hypothetical protein
VQVLPAMMTRPELLCLYGVPTVVSLTFIRMNKTRETCLPRIDGLLLCPPGYRNGDIVCFTAIFLVVAG